MAEIFSDFVYEQKKISRMSLNTTFSHHGEVDVGGIELHVDLLVDVGLGVGVEVLADLGHLGTRRRRRRSF